MRPLDVGMRPCASSDVCLCCRLTRTGSTLAGADLRGLMQYIKLKRGLKRLRKPDLGVVTRWLFDDDLLEWLLETTDEAKAKEAAEVEARARSKLERLEQSCFTGFLEGGQNQDSRLFCLVSFFAAIRVAREVENLHWYRQNIKY